MANNETGSSISKAKLEELRKRAENRRAGSSPTYKASATGSSVSAAKLAELKKKAKTKKTTTQNVPSIIAEMRSKSGQGKATVAKAVNAKKDKPTKQNVPSIIAEIRSKKPTKIGKSTGSSVSATQLAELKKKAKANSQKPKTENVPSIIAELRSKKPKKSTTADKKTTTVVKTAPKKESNFTKASVKSNEVNYNVGVSKGGVSFNKAFAHFRKKGAKTFTWNGKKYTTELAKSGKKSKPKGMAV
tara:strand:- start:91 stop:825 length:735 start_codon:yes stop_codon:yes gene_type:complete